MSCKIKCEVYDFYLNYSIMNNYCSKLSFNYIIKYFIYVIKENIDVGNLLIKMNTYLKIV